MFGRLADLTWKHPKLILALVGAFAVLSVAIGKDVEQHLQAAGFTDSASESEKVTAAVVGAAGYDPNPGLVLVVRGPGGGPLDTDDPGVRREVDRLSHEVAGVEHVGLRPAADRRAAAQLVARDGGSLIVSVTSTPPTSRTRAALSPKTCSRWQKPAGWTSRWPASPPASTR